MSAQSSDDEKAQEHFDRGAQSYMEGDYSAAIVEFEKAYKYREHPVFLYNMARGYARLNRCEKVLETVARIDDPDALEKKARAKLDATAEACRQIQGARSAVQRRTAKRDEPEESETDEEETETDQEREQREATGETQQPAPEDESDGDERRASAGHSVSPVLKWGSIGLGAALLGAGTLQDWMATRQRLQSVDSSGSITQSRQSELRARARRSRGTTIALYAAGGAFLATGITLFVVDSGGAEAGGRDGRSAEPSASLVIGPPSRLLQLDGRW